MAIATVLSITGQAWARDAEGNLRELRVGDTLQEGEVLITSDNGSAQLDFGDGLEAAFVEGGEQVIMMPELDADEPADSSEFAALDEDLEALLTALDDESVDLLDVLDATAAGAGPGGGADGGHSFVRLARIAEDVNPLAFEFGLGQASDLPETEGAFFDIVEPSAGTLDASLFDAETLSEAGSVVTGTLPFSFGTGVNGSVTFAGMDGVQVQVGQESIVYSWDAGSNTLTAFSPGRELNIFTLQVNPATGEFTLTQLNNLLHEEGADEALTSLVYTVTSTSGTAEGTLNVSIADDNPVVESVEASDALSELTLDTSDAELAPPFLWYMISGGSPGEGPILEFPPFEGQQPGDESPLPPRPPFMSNSQDLSAFFEANINWGADDPGSDSARAANTQWAYELSLNGESEGPVDSGLSAGEQPIFLHLVNGMIVGSTSETAPSVESGAEDIAFVLHLDGSQISLVQFKAIDHPNPEDPSETISLADGLIELTGTVTVVDTDGDTDSNSAVIDLGSLLDFVDDGPELELGEVDLSEVAFETDDSETINDTSVATGSVAAAFDAAVTAQYGGDGAGDVTIDGYGLTLGEVVHGLTSGGIDIVFSLVDGVVIGRAGETEVLRIEIDAGSGAVTVTQSGPVDHAEQGVDSVGLPAGLVGVTATVTVTDSDGDVVSDSLSADLSGTITIVDDMPSVEPNPGDLAELEVDESAFGEPATTDFSGAFAIVFGADGEGSVSYGLSIDGDGATGLVTTDGGQAITLIDDNGTIIGQAADGRVAFTITVNAATGEVTLTQNLALSHPDGTNPADVLGLAGSGLKLNATATDSDGDTISAGIDLGGQLSFVDDGPQANNDLALVRVGRFEKSGNVMANDDQGADGAEVTHVQFGGETVELIDGVAVIQGVHGELTIYSNGDYTYVRGDTPNHQGLFLDKFTYTLTDGDGDTDTATLNVKGLDAGVVIYNPVAGQGAHLVVNEANLADGTDPNAGELTQSGGFLVGAVDGLEQLTISIGGGGDQQTLTVTRNENGGFNFGDASIDVPDGYRLEVTGITPLPLGGYFVSYAYTLQGNKAHADSEDNALVRGFTITVTDRDGDTASSSLKVKVIDDVPTAELDGRKNATEGGNAITGSWNTESGADSEGAQQLISINGGPEQALQIGHAYELAEGTLTINENGTWTFVPGTNLDHSNGKVPVSFELIVIDGDGDRASDTHHIKIKDGSDPTPGGENGEGSTVDLVVDELGLREGGDVELANAEAELTFTAGSDNIVDFAFVNPGDISVSGLEEGLELTWEINEAGELIGSLGDEPVLKLTLNGGEIAAGESGTVTVNVELIGNLPHHANVDELTIGGVQVVATDSDGDVSAPGSISVRVDDDLPSVEGTDPSGHEVVITNMNSLAGYNNSFGYYIKDENGNPTSGMVVWANVKQDKGASYVLEGHAPGDIGYFIIPNGANLNPGLGNETEVTFELVNGVWVAVTQDGELSGQNANAPVLFNDPSLNPGGASHVENNLEEGDLNWEDVYGGGDNDYNDVNIKVEWKPANLTVDESNLDVDAEFDFSGYFSAEYGADGLEESSYSLSVAENGTDSGLVDTQTGGEVLVKEGDDGQIVGYVVIGDEEVPVFTLSVDADTGVVTLDQLRAVIHSGAGQVGASDVTNILANVVFLTKTVVDTDSDEASATIDIGKVIHFLDDGPTAVNDGFNLGAGQSIENGNVLSNDQVGSDGGKVTAVNGTSVPAEGPIDIQGQYGVLTIAADGTYSYVRNPGAPGSVSDVFTYTLTDGDGDSDTATLTIAISDSPVDIDNDKPQGQNAHLIFNEAHLPGGTEPNANALTQGGSFTVSAPDGVLNLSVGGEAIVEDGQVVAELPEISTASGNVLKITDYVANGDGTYTVSYEYTLNANKDHEQPADDESLTQSFQVVLVDTDGDTASSNLLVQILDDAPEFGTPDDASLGLDSGSTANGSLELTIGADADGAHISQAKLLADEQGYLQVRYEENGVEKTTHLTSGGQKLVYVFDAENQQLIAYKEGEDSSNPVLTIDLSVGSNQYVVNVLQPLDSVANTFEAKVAKVQGGGNDYVLEIDSDNLEIQFTATGGSVNWSSQGIGVGNNWINPGETLIANFNQVTTQLDLTLGKNGDDGAISWKAYKEGQLVSEGSSTSIAVEGGFDRIEFTAVGGKYVIKEFGGTYLDAEHDFTLPVEVVAIDGDGDTSEGAFDINFEPGTVPPLPELPTILGLTESDVTVNEQYLQGGTAEGEGAPASDGSFALSAPEGLEALLLAGALQSGAGEQQGDNVKLGADDLESLAGGNVIVIETPEGNTLTLTGYDSTTGQISYSFELGGAVEHETGEGHNEQTKEGIQVELVDELGNIAYGTIDVVIVDDVPESFDNVQAIQVPVSELEVGGLNAGWDNVRGTSGAGNITTSSNASGISMQWGGSSGSGYQFAYADGLTDSTGVATDSLFSLGTFTHNNFSISSGQKTLDTAELDVTFKVMIDGVLTEVTTTVKLKHEETPNSGTLTNPENDDIIKIINPEQEQVIRVGDREYVLKIRGFLDGGELVETVYTTETEATSFELYAEIASTDDLPSVEGKVDADWGADGPAEEDSLLWSDGEGGTLASGTVEGQYGTLIVNADGSYTYVISRSARDGMKADESYQEEFTYYLTDADGDRVESKLNINLAGVPNGIVASDNVATVDVSLIDITPDPVHSQVMGNKTSQHNTSAVRTDSYSETFTVGEGSTGQFSFQVDFSTPGNSKAELNWSLWQKNNSGQWIEVTDVGGAASSGVNGANGLEAGDYRVDFSAKTSGSHKAWIIWPIWSETSYSKVDIGQVALVQQPESYQEPQVSPVEGNVLTDPGVDGSTDIPGSSGTLLKVLVGSDYVDATEGGLAVAGQYGTFTFYANGDYRYEPDADVAHVGKIDSLTYQLVHPSGATAEASLEVGITGSGVDSFVWGTDGDDTVTGSSGNDVIIGGAGDDTLAGGLGADTLVWNLGDQGEEGSAAVDTVKDFQQGVFGTDADADRLDLAELLQGEESRELGDFVFAAEESGNVVLYISSDGSLGGDKANADQVITLEGKAFSDFGANVDDSADLLQKMLASGQLNIDQ